MPVPAWPAVADASVPPSERPTRPTLPPPGSSADVIELSGSALISEASERPPGGAEAPRASVARTDPPPSPRRRAWTRGRGLALAAALACVALAGLGVASGPGDRAPSRRAPRAVAEARTPLEFVRGAEVPPPLPTALGCAPAGAPRVLSSRAELGPGLDVGVLGDGFGIGFARSRLEARAVRVDGPAFQIVERLRVRVDAPVRHVATLAADDAAIDLRVDRGPGRTVVPDGSGAPFRIGARRGHVVASTGGDDARALWALPKAARGSRVVVRASPRDDGGAVVAIGARGSLWTGALDATLSPEGPLVELRRPDAELGAPSVAAWGGGGALAWAERPPRGSFHVLVAALGAGPPRVIDEGMSPSVTTLPNGDLLLAYAKGRRGDHRVVVRRLGPDLAPRAAPVAVSPEAMNAGQPRAAVRSDGRGVVAFFAAGPRGRAAEVVAVPLACDPGL